MSILHLVRTSAYQHNDLAQCLQVCSASDTIVLLDEGCYNITHSLLNETKIKVYAISEHCSARAITYSVQQSLTLTQLTSLFISHHSVLTWQ